MSTPAVSVPSVDQVESRVARDLTRHALLVAPVAIVGVGLWRGVDGALGVALALTIVCANFLLSAAMLGWGARRSPNLLMGIALGAFLGRLVLITAVGVGMKALDIVDFPVFCIALIVSHLGLLFWETRSISLSLASPGLKPAPDVLPVRSLGASDCPSSPTFCRTSTSSSSGRASSAATRGTTFNKTALMAFVSTA